MIARSLNGIILEQRLYDFLSVDRTEVSRIFRNYSNTGEINYLTLSEENSDCIKFLPRKKVPEIKGWAFDYDGVLKSNENKTEIKIGRAIRKLLDFKKYNISDKQLEDFVNSFKSFFDSSLITFEIVDGERIRDSYLQDNYLYWNTDFGGGTLLSSCMRHLEKMKYLDIYVYNPNSVKLVVMYQDINGDKKVRGRALLWEATDENGVKVKLMDRIYYTYDSDILTFQKWANENGYSYKTVQGAGEQQSITHLNGLNASKLLSVVLDNSDFSYYPYLDTFTYLDQRRDTLYNYQHVLTEYTLQQTNGMIEEERDEEEVFDDEEEGEW